MKILEEHSGAVLIASGVFLKIGSMASSLILVTPGYILLGVVICYKVKKWRDHDDREN